MPEPQAPNTRRRKRWRALRITLLLFVLVVVSVAGAVRLLAPRFLVLPAIEHALGCDAASDRIEVTPSGTFVLHDLSLRARGVPGDAAEFLYVQEARVDPAWYALLVGGSPVSRVVLNGVRTRISHGADSTINLASVNPAISSGGGGGTLPVVEITAGAIELAEHDDRGRVTILERIPVRGRLWTDTDDVARVRFEELTIRTTTEDLPDDRTPILIEGSFDPEADRGELRIDRLELDRWGDRRAPERFADVWTWMDVSGAVDETVFEYDPRAGVTTRLTLDSVSVNIPIPVSDERAATPDGREQIVRTNQGAPFALMEMRDVSGTFIVGTTGIDANLAGRVERVNCAVTFDAPDPTLAQGYVVRIAANDVELTEDPRLLPFSPSYVRRIFERFQSPTARVNGFVVLTDRGPDTPEGQRRTSVEGLLQLTDGRITYEHFRYPIDAVAGTVGFDDEKIELTLSGRGTHGGVMFAEGLISPPGDGAEVAIDITLDRVPMGEHIRAAVPAERSGIFDALFDDERYAALIADGLLITEAHAEVLEDRASELRSAVRRAEAQDEPDGALLASLRTDLDRVRAELEVPAFDLGGLAAVDVQVRRAFGPDSPFTRDMVVRFDRAGIIPQRFPYPLIAEDVRIEIEAGFARVPSATLRGLTGAVGSLAARIDWGGDDGAYRPNIVIDNANVPVDEYLIRAIPGDRVGEGDAPLAFSPRTFLLGLNLSGTVACSAQVRPRLQEGDETLRVEIGIDGLRARPMGKGNGLEIDDIAGLVTVTDREIKTPGLTGTLQGQPFDLDLVAKLRTGEFGGRVRVTRYDLETPIEAIVALLSREQGDVIGTLRAEREPRGIIDAQLDLTNRGDGIDYAVRADNFEDLSLRIEDERLAARGASGAIDLTEDALTFDRFGARVRFGDQPLGAVQLDGRWAIDERDASELHATLSGARFESPVVRRVVPARLRDPIVAYELAGAFDASGTLTRERAPAHEEPNELRFVGELRPHELSLTRNGVRAEMHTVRGAIGVDGASGTFDDLVAEGEGWNARVNGRWAASGGTRLDLDLSFEASDNAQAPRAFLPVTMLDRLERVGFRYDGAISSQDARLSLARTQPDRPWDVAFTGDVQGFGIALDTGIPLDMIDGVARIDYQSRLGDRGDLTLDVRAGSLRAAGVTLTDGFLELHTDPDTGALRVPTIEAQTHGGSVAGRVLMWDSAPARYEARLELAGIDFQRALADLKTAGDTEPVQRDGVLAGSLDLQGVVGSPDALVGRGVFEVKGTNILYLDKVLPAIQLSNLQLPGGSAIHRAAAELHAIGRTLHVSDLTASATGLSIVGEGTIGLPDLELDLRVNSRSDRRVPILTPLIEGVRDEFITTHVTGTLRDPRFRYQQLKNTRRLFGPFFAERDDAETDDDSEGALADVQDNESSQ
ncbi:MAG: hypothetical protein AAGD00_01340 [Planctomycetota bacterium]